jgi:hypothetical protein
MTKDEIADYYRNELVKLCGNGNDADHIDGQTSDT